VREAKTRLDAAREAYDVLDGQVVPQTKQAVEAVGAAFASGQEASLGMLDSLRAYLQVRLERARALARLHAALADLEKAAGHLHGLGTTPEEGKKP
jgi:outer membrane protein TolC